jgi:hypothetical protein
MFHSARVVARADDLLHQHQRAADHGAAGLAGVEEVLLVHLLRLRVVADEDELDLLVVPGQEQVQQDEEALGQLLAPSSIEPETSIRQNITALLVGTGTRMRLR